MTRFQEHIEVYAPPEVAYAAWDGFAYLPRFISGMRSVEPLSEGRYRWQGSAGGQPYTWEIEVTERVPGERLAWSCLGGPCQDWAVNFTSLPGERTLVTLTLDCDPQGYSTVNNTVSPEALWADMERFRHLVETQSGQLVQNAEEREAHREQRVERRRTVGGVE